MLKEIEKSRIVCAHVWENTPLGKSKWLGIIVTQDRWKLAVGDKTGKGWSQACGLFIPGHVHASVRGACEEPFVF